MSRGPITLTKDAERQKRISRFGPCRLPGRYTVSLYRPTVNRRIQQSPGLGLFPERVWT
jgi:hypothetical protein